MHSAVLLDLSCAMGVACHCNLNCFETVCQRKSDAITNRSIILRKQPAILVASGTSCSLGQRHYLHASDTHIARQFTWKMPKCCGFLTRSKMVDGVLWKTFHAASDDVTENR